MWNRSMSEDVHAVHHFTMKTAPMRNFRIVEEETGVEDSYLVRVSPSGIRVYTGRADKRNVEKRAWQFTWQLACLRSYKECWISESTDGEKEGGIVLVALTDRDYLFISCNKFCVFRLPTREPISIVHVYRESDKFDVLFASKDLAIYASHMNWSPAADLDNIELVGKNAKALLDRVIDIARGERVAPGTDVFTTEGVPPPRRLPTLLDIDSPKSPIISPWLYQRLAAIEIADGE